MMTVALAFMAVSFQAPTVAVDMRASEHLRYGAAGYGRPGTTLILREAFAALHSSETKAPLWVAYRLNPAYSVNIVPRAGTSAWKPEPLIPPGFRAELSDYAGTGFDRGHMAPAEDMRRSQAVQLDSFHLSNSVPQNRSNNSGPWNSLESTARMYGRTTDLIIISGPIYDRPGPDGTVSLPLTKPGGIPVPSRLFKIIVRERPNGVPEVLAFIMNNAPIPSFQARNHLVAVRDIEAATGLNFLNALSPAVQNQIETQPAPALWSS